MKPLDLAVHDVEEIAGKSIVIGGATYVIEPMVNEGGEAWVFPLRNVRSGLAQFLGKLYKFARDSPEMKSLLERVRTGAPPLTGFSAKARAGAQSTLHSVLHAEEIHEAGGGVFRFTRFLRDQPDSHPAYDAKRMKAAEALMRGGRFDEAVAVYDAILADHPQHSEALLDKGIALSAKNAHKDALEPLQTALEIEPNDTRATAVLSHVQEALFRPEFALQAVQNSLARWKWDFPLWVRELEIALAWDFVELAESRIRELRALVPEASRLPSLEQQAKESNERRRIFTTELAKAVALQSRHRDFERAKAHCLAAAKASRRNTLARLNLAICCYHTGDFPHAAGEALEVLERFVGLARPGATILALVSVARSGRPDVAAKIVRWIDDAPGADLGGIPIAVDETTSIESPSGTLVAEILAKLPRTDPGIARRIDHLIARYRAAGD